MPIWIWIFLSRGFPNQSYSTQSDKFQSQVSVSESDTITSARDASASEKLYSSISLECVMCIFYIAILCMCVIWTLDGHWKSFVLDEKDRSRYFPFSVFCHPSSVIYWMSGPQVHFIQRFFYVSSTSLQLSLGKNSHNLTPKKCPCTSICEQLFIFSFYIFIWYFHFHQFVSNFLYFHFIFSFTSICEQLFIFSSGSDAERSLGKFWRN